MGFACPILVDDGFDSIAIRVNDKCGVVMEAIVRPQTWQAMIPPTVFKRSRVKLIDSLSTWCRKS